MKTKPKPIFHPLTIVDDGQLDITIDGGPGDGQKIVIDVSEAMLEFDAIQAFHTKGDKFTATADFLRDLSAACERLGVKPCSATVAYRIWHAASDRYYSLKKNTPTPRK